VDSIKIDVREIVWDGMDCVHVAQDWDQWGGSCEHGDKLSVSIKYWEVTEYLHN
jgi:hypothetical protein